MSGLNGDVPAYPGTLVSDASFSCCEEANSTECQVPAINELLELENLCQDISSYIAFALDGDSQEINIKSIEAVLVELENDFRNKYSDHHYFPEASETAASIYEELERIGRVDHETMQLLHKHLRGLSKEVLKMGAFFPLAKFEKDLRFLAEEISGDWLRKDSALNPFLEYVTSFLFSSGGQCPSAYYIPGQVVLAQAAE